MGLPDRDYYSVLTDTYANFHDMDSCRLGSCTGEDCICSCHDEGLPRLPEASRS